jgi:signal transduction histidine kinase
LEAPLSTPVRVDASGIWSYSSAERSFLGTIGVAKDVTTGGKTGKSRASGFLIGLLDEEKSRIAAELHDNVGQILISIKMDLERIKRGIDAVPGPVNEWVEAAIGKSVEAIKDLREIAQGLKPVALESIDLVTALHNLFEDIRDRSGLRIDFFHDRVPLDMAFPVKLAIFRIAQEALTNVIKHSGATKVHFNLFGRGHTLTLAVEDDGVGFDPNGPAGKPTLGLLIMKERATQMGGELCIESSRGQGTHLLVEIPLISCRA